MRTKWQNTSLSLLAALALLLTSCGNRNVREEIIPRYRFAMNETLAYKMSLNLDLTADAGLFRFSGNIGLTMDADVKAVATNQWGYKLQVAMRNPNVTGASGQVNTSVIAALNFIRNYLSTIYIQTNGKVTVPFEGNPHPGLSSYGQMIFPDFIDMPGLWAGTRTKVEFATKMEEKKFMEIMEIESHIARYEAPYLVIDRKVTVKIYDLESYRNSADPQEEGSAEINFTDRFDAVRGVLVSKDGYFFLSGAVRVSRGILGYTISLSGSGSFKMNLAGEPAS